VGGPVERDPCDEAVRGSRELTVFVNSRTRSVLGIRVAVVTQRRIHCVVEMNAAELERSE
jgi:hypothetical protein